MKMKLGGKQDTRNGTYELGHQNGSPTIEFQKFIKREGWELSK